MHINADLSLNSDLKQVLFLNILDVLYEGGPGAGNLFNTPSFYDWTSFFSQFHTMSACTVW